MPDELNARLLAKLPEIKLESVDFITGPQSHAIETQLLKLAALPMDQEIEILREILRILGKAN